MHQLHQLQDQLIFIKTSSDKESEDSFIKENQNFRRRQNLSMGNNPNSIKFIKLRSRKSNFFYCGSTCCLQKIQDSPPILRDIWLQLFENFPRVWFLSHELKKIKDEFHRFSPTNSSQMRKKPSSLVFHQERASRAGDL